MVEGAEVGGLELGVGVELGVANAGVGVDGLMADSRRAENERGPEVNR